MLTPEAPKPQESNLVGEITKPAPFAQELLYLLPPEFHRTSIEVPGDIAWQLVRQKRNPFFTKGTGFEGYFIGECNSAEQAKDLLLQQVGYPTQDYIRMRFPHSWQSRNNIMKALHGERFTGESLRFWEAQLGAIIARMRAGLMRNPKAQSFRDGTYRMISGRTRMNIEPGPTGLIEKYNLPNYSNGNSAIDIKSFAQDMNDRDREALLICRKIGMFGQQLVRQAARELH